MSLKQISNQDTLFIAAENETCYQHISGLVILDGTKVPGFGFEKFKAHLVNRLPLVPQFRWKLIEVPMGLDRPYWVEDENFSFDNHIKRVSVPSPGDRQAVAETVGMLYARHLDRDRPLWRVWFLEGLENGRHGMLFTIHHVMMDGQGANIIAKLLYKLGSSEDFPEIDEEISNARPGNVPTKKEIYRQARTGIAGIPRKAASMLYSGYLRPKMKSWFDKSSKDAAPSETSEAPKSQLLPAPFNAKISRERGIVYGSVPLNDVLAVKSHYDVTVNDVVMAIVAGGLRRYFIAHGNLPTQAIIGGMAVSLRAEGDENFSNKVTVMPVSLATDQEDPEKRLKTINRESTRGKELARANQAMGIMEILQLLPPVLIEALNNFSNLEQKVQMSGMNVLISYVRNSPVPFYMEGAKVEAVIPVSIISDGGGLNITCVTYLDQLQFGLTFDPALIPGAWSLADHFEEALADYVKLINKQSAPSASKSAGAAKRKTTARRKKTSARKKA